MGGYLGRGSAEVELGIAKSNSVSATGAWPLDLAQGPKTFYRPGTGVQATIDGVHNNSTTTINVLAGTGVLFKPAMVFAVTCAAATTEIFKVLSISTDALTVDTRAFAGTAAALAGGESILPYNPQGAEHESYAATVAAGGDGVIDMSGWTHGIVIVPSAWTAADLTFQTSTKRNGTYVDVCDDTGTLVRITTILTSTSQAYRLPLDVFRCNWVKFRSTNTASGAAVTQGADRLLTVHLKK
jgi:hypothetical protein